MMREILIGVPDGEESFGRSAPTSVPEHYQQFARLGSGTEGGSCY